MTTIKISSSNYKDFTNFNIIAFSYAEPGAMGERGSVYAITSDNEVLHMNFIGGNINIEEVQAVLPILKECREKKFVYAPEGWSMKRLGFGNYLIVNNIVIDKFNLLTIKFDQIEIYKKWKDVISNILLEESLGV